MERANYKRIGSFIQLVDERNTALEVNTLLGLSISKKFIPSVANTVGTNMARYKIIRKNQFACSLMQVRRDKKMPVALQKDFAAAIISQAYPVFKVIDEEQLLPDYLMMWMTRSEFDRQACFLAVGGVRGSLEWEDFLEMELPVPSIEKQREIVKEYNTIVNRIKLNEQLNQKLEETAQAIYKHWFVDFEFPDENGMPYKSNGGEMDWNEELGKEVPTGWKVETLLNNTSLLKRGISPKYTNIANTIVINQKCIRHNTVDLSLSRFHDPKKKNIPNEKIIQLNDVLINSTGTGTLGRVGIVKKIESEMTADSHVTIVRANENLSKYYLSNFLANNEDLIIELGEGSTGQTELSRNNLGAMLLLLPSFEVQILFEDIIKKVVNHSISIELFLPRLLKLKDLILAKMTKVETEKSDINIK